MSASGPQGGERPFGRARKLAETLPEGRDTPLALEPVAPAPAVDRRASRCSSVAVPTPASPARRFSSALIAAWRWPVRRASARATSWFARRSSSLRAAPPGGSPEPPGSAGALGRSSTSPGSSSPTAASSGSSPSSGTLTSVATAETTANNESCSPSPSCADASAAHSWPGGCARGARRMWRRCSATSAAMRRRRTSSGM